MCTGAEPYLLAASLAATAAGTAAQVNANKKREGATTAAAAADLERKAKTSREANAIFNAELENSDAGDASKAVDDAAAQQLAETQRLLSRSPEDTGFQAPTDTSAAMTNASPVVKDVAARTLADELAKTEAQMKAASTLQGFKKRQLNRANQFGRAGEQMAMLGNFNQGWSNVADVQQQMAQFAGAKQAMLGDVLTGLGSMGSAYYGATKGSAPASSSSPVLSTGSGSNPYGYTSQIPSTYATRPTTSALGNRYFM